MNDSATSELHEDLQKNQAWLRKRTAELLSLLEEDPLTYFPLVEAVHGMILSANTCKCIKAKIDSIERGINEL